MNDGMWYMPYTIDGASYYDGDEGRPPPGNQPGQNTQFIDGRWYVVAPEHAYDPAVHGGGGGYSGDDASGYGGGGAAYGGQPFDQSGQYP